MNAKETAYRYHLQRAIKAAVAKAGGAQVVADRADLHVNEVYDVARKYLPSVRRLLPIAEACGTTLGAIFADADARVRACAAIETDYDDLEAGLFFPHG